MSFQVRSDGSSRDGAYPDQGNSLSEWRLSAGNRSAGDDCRLEEKYAGRDVNVISARRPAPAVNRSEIQSPASA